MNWTDLISKAILSFSLLDEGDMPHMHEGGMYFMGYWMPWMMFFGILTGILIIILIIYLITRLGDRGEKVIVVK